MNKSSRIHFIIIIACAFLWTGCSDKNLASKIMSNDNTIHAKALQKAAKLSEEKKILLADELIASLSNPDNRIPHRAVEGLGAVGGPAVPALIKEMDNPDVLVRANILTVIGLIGIAARQAESVVIKSLSDLHPLVREEAALTLGRLAPSEPAITALQKAANDPAAEVRAAAEGSLKMARAETPAAVPAPIPR